MRFVFLPVHRCIHIYITKLVNARKPTQHTQHIYTLYRKASSRGFWRIINESRRRNALDKLPARVSCDFSIESPIAASHERLMGNALRRVAHPNRLFFFPVVVLGVALCRGPAAARYANLVRTHDNSWMYFSWAKVEWAESMLGVWLDEQSCWWICEAAVHTQRGRFYA